MLLNSEQQRIKKPDMKEALFKFYYVIWEIKLSFINIIHIIIMIYFKFSRW